MGGSKDWTFAIITIDTTTSSWQETGLGVYLGSYAPSLTKFAVSPGQSHIILIDVRKTIQSFPDHPQYEQVLVNAGRNTEWLMLPASPIILNGGKVEFSGIMDGRCISEIEKFVKIR